MSESDQPEGGIAAMEREWDEAIEKSGAMTESQLRAMKAPSPKTPEDLMAFIASLVQRRHDYGTCVYAMSLSATAALNYVASQVGASGFQGSCADLDIIRRTRCIEGPFRIVNYSDLLFPQYLDEGHVPGWRDAINNEDIRKWLREKSSEKLAAGIDAHAAVVAHWHKLVSEEKF